MTTEIAIWSVILGIPSSLIASFLYAEIQRYQPIKKLINIKAIKYLVFILLYALPLGTIIMMIADQSLEPTFKNISLFIIICVLFVYNIIMRSIISIYNMIILGAKHQNETVQFLEKEFETIYKEIEYLKSKG